MNSRVTSRHDFADAVSRPGWSGCEGLIKAFETAWRSGPAPKIADYLRSDGETRIALLLELVHVDLEFRMKSGEAVRPEAYLDVFPELADDERVLADLRAAVEELRERSSERIDPQHGASRFTADEVARSKQLTW